MHEQLNEPTEPTQMQIDGRFIKKLMLVLGECHYFVNRMSADRSQFEVRQAIEALIRDPEWQRHFKKMTAQQRPGVT